MGVPFPPIGGGLLRTFHLLRALAAHHEVVLAGFTYDDQAPPAAPPYPVQIEAVPWRWSAAYQEMVGADRESAGRAARQLAFDSDDPWFVGVMDLAPMRERLPRLCRTGFDLVLLEGTPLAAFVPDVPADVPRVLDLFDVHSVMARRALDQAQPDDRPARAREVDRVQAFERRAVAACRACIAVSDEDAAAAHQLLGATQVHVVPNGVDTSYFAPDGSRRDPGKVLFTGRMSYPPNAEAAVHFARQVLPLVQREVPHARFHVVGDSPPGEVEALGETVAIHGRVGDMLMHQRTAEVVVVPVRSGGGTRLKLLEAAACGNAVVSTPLGAEGLTFEPGRDLLVADTDADFAAAVVELLRDPDHRAALGVRARAAACRYDWRAIGETFLHVIEATAGPG